MPWRRHDPKLWENTPRRLSTRLQWKHFPPQISLQSFLERHNTYKAQGHVNAAVGYIKLTQYRFPLVDVLAHLIKPVSDCTSLLTRM